MGNFRKQEELVVSVEIISLISLPCSGKVRTKSQTHPEYCCKGRSGEEVAWMNLHKTDRHKKRNAYIIYLKTHCFTEWLH